MTLREIAKRYAAVGGEYLKMDELVSIPSSFFTLVDYLFLHTLEEKCLDSQV